MTDSTATFFGREQLLAKDDLLPVAVDLEGTQAYIAQLGASERDELEEAWREEQNEDSNIGLRAFIVTFCLCDPDGKRLFANDYHSQYRKVGKLKKASTISRLFNVACKTNGLMKEDVEALEKN